MRPDETIAKAKEGVLQPVYLVMGEERWLEARVVHALRDAVLSSGIPGFNDDKFEASETTAEAILGAARMVPMMAKRRLVLVRGLERWEKRSEGDDNDSDDERPKGVARAASPLDALAEYCKAPIDSTVLVLVATKLNAQRRLVSLAKKQDFLVTCDALKRHELPTFVSKLAREKGHTISPDVASFLADIGGDELSYFADAIERLSLFVGKGKPITEEAVMTMVARVRQSTVWELIDALGQKNVGRALATLTDVFESRDGGLPLLGAIAWSVRQLVRFESEIEKGRPVQEAAQRAHVPPFKVNELQRTLKGVPKGTFVRWLNLLSEADVALKSSRRPGQAILESLVISMCT